MRLRQRIYALAAAALVVAAWLPGAPSQSAASPSIESGPGITQALLGSFRITNRIDSSRCLQLHPNQGTLVGLVPCNSQSIHQIWDLTQAPNDFRAFVMRNRAGGCLDADNQGGRPTFIAHVIPCNVANNPHQQWKFANNAIGNIGPVCPLAYCGLRNTLVLDNSLDDRQRDVPGWRVNLWPPNGGDAQLFVFQGVPL